ncbi:MAG: 5-oxoprolinase subunit PxpA [Gemmatimonadales bacterium]|nr:5-oxoprolinase subunit PxpA [Gemmatimonadales bacterium]
MIRIDLNGDMGESFGTWALGDDDAMLRHVTSANIACGFHAGDPTTMRRTVRLALDRGVAVGAHPGYPDLAGFGRRAMACTPDEVRDLVTYQVGALAAFAAAEGGRLAHVKPHGALYNAAARDQRLADAIAEAVRAVDPTLVLVGLAGSELMAAAERAGLAAAHEAFADRAYGADGHLVPRSDPAAVIDDPARAAAQAVDLALHRRVHALDGTALTIRADTLCLHGDAPGAEARAAAIREALARAGVTVARLARAAR